MPWMRYSIRTSRRSRCQWNHISFLLTKRAMSLIGENSTTAKLPCPLPPREERLASVPMQMEQLPGSIAMTPTVVEVVPTGDASGAVVRTRGGLLGEIESVGHRHGLPRTDRQTGRMLTIVIEIERLATAGRVVGQI